MSLAPYFSRLIRKVEESDISNQGTDKNGFFLPTRAVLLRHLTLLKDLHAKPLARQMVRDSWNFVATELPPEWLMPSPEEQTELRDLFGDAARSSER
jgi:hypothetical protein